MARNRTTFPAASARGAAILCSATLVAMLAFTPSANAITHQKVLAAKAEVHRLLTRVADAKKQLTTLQTQLATVSDELLTAQDQYDQIVAQLLVTQNKVKETQATLDDVQARLDARAEDVFIGGTTSNLDFILGATSLANLSDRLEFSDALQQSDADLAQQVQNAKNELLYQKKQQLQLERKQRDVVATLKQKRAEVNANFQRQQGLLDQIHSDLTAARKTFLKYSKEWKKQLAASLGVGNASGILKVCPVGQPRAFSDGFGAPRYTGGFHLHAGVDILAPFGTPIYAPFDGNAVRGYNSLGGYAVYVYGSQGYVYNAHLSSYGTLGHVSAGTVIGYVGSTGDAGTTNHDHFEWHPNVIPSNWPQSAYGYSVIGDAVNPYPLLVAACL